MVEAERVKDRGHEVARLHGPLGGKRADGVARPHDPPSLHAAAGEGAGENLRPVVAAAGGIHLRRAAKLREPGDERVVEEAAIVQIGDQRGIALVVHRADDVFHALDRRERLRAVDVPRDFVKHGEKRVDRDEPHAVFDQPPREQAALAEAVHAVSFADGLRLLRQVEGLAGLRARHQAVGGLEVVVEEAGIFARLKLPGRRLHNLPHLAAAAEPGHGDLVGRQEVGHAEVGLGGIGHQGKRVVGLAEEAAGLAVGKVATAAAHQFGEHHKRWEIGPPAEQVAGHTAGMRRLDAAGEPSAGLHDLPAGVVHRGAIVVAAANE